MMKQTVIICLTLFYTGVFGKPSQPGWRLTGAKNGIELYEKEASGSSIVALRGKGTIEAPVWKVASVLLDTARAPEWVDSLARSSVVRKIDATHYIEYNHIKTPFIMKDRDFVSSVVISVDKSRTGFSLRYRPSEDPAAPKTSHVRGRILFARFEVTSVNSDKSILDAEIQCDPMGSVPKWVVNLFQKSWPEDTFEALRAQTKKADITIPSAFSDVIRPLAYRSSSLSSTTTVAADSSPPSYSRRRKSPSR